MKIMNTVAIDEVGRGPLAGPLTLGGVKVSHVNKRKVEKMLLEYGVTDSKKLTAGKREVYAHEIMRLKREGLLAYVTVSISPADIDKKGMSWCIKKALRTVLRRLEAQPDIDMILLDGSLYAPPEFVSQETIIKGDEKEVLIGAASILAKVKRDRYMEKIAKDDKYAQYGFEVHKGYGTKKHMEAIGKHGCSSQHRRSFCRNISLSNFYRKLLQKRLFTVYSFPLCHHECE
jgi:ribonuclease HII